MRRHPIRRLLPAVLLGSLLLTSGAAAQVSPLIDTPVFRLNDDGGLVSRGTFGEGSIASSGPGQRLLWYPAKAAFRAGSVTGFHWDPSFIGAYSVAMGFNATASGDYAVAMGERSEASGTWSTALGDNTTASGFASTALGGATTASGNYATAMGIGTEASGRYTTVIGDNTTAQAYASLVLGRFNTIAGDPLFWVSTDPVLVVGNGTFNSPSNAFTLLKNGDLTIAGTLTENSDRRLKRDIQPLADAVSALARVQPVRYRFREGTNRPKGEQIGLIAQEVETIFPELVSRGADGYLSVSYTHLVAVLVQALNEQQDQIDALKTHQQAEIETLRANNTALHERLSQIEAALQLSATPASASPDAR